MEIAGLVLLILGTSYGAVRLYWSWQDRREAKQDRLAEEQEIKAAIDRLEKGQGPKLISDRDAVAQAWRMREHWQELERGRSGGVRWSRPFVTRTGLRNFVAAAAVVAGRMLLLLSRL